MISEQSHGMRLLEHPALGRKKKSQYFSARTEVRGLNDRIKEWIMKKSLACIWIAVRSTSSSAAPAGSQVEENFAAAFPDAATTGHKEQGIFAVATLSRYGPLKERNVNNVVSWWGEV